MGPKSMFLLAVKLDGKMAAKLDELKVVLKVDVKFAVMVN